MATRIPDNSDQDDDKVYTSSSRRQSLHLMEARAVSLSAAWAASVW